MFRELLTRIAKELNKHHIPYMVIGGQAVLLYGEPRLTKDIDITLDMGFKGFEKIRDVVEKLNFRILIDNPEDFVKKTMVLPVMDDKTGIKVDFILSFSPYEKQAIESSIDVKFGNTIVKFASLEDVIIHKIIAGRARDLEDIKSILLKNTDYESKYIKKWLKKFDESLNKNFIEVFKKVEEEIYENKEL